MSTRNDGGTVVEPGAGQALERTQRALEAAERAEQALNEAKSGKGSGRLRRLLLLLVIGAVAAVVIRRLTAKDAATTAPAATPTDAPSSADGVVTSTRATPVAPAAARNGDQPDPQPGDATQTPAPSEDPAS